MLNKSHSCQKYCCWPSACKQEWETQRLIVGLHQIVYHTMCTQYNDTVFRNACMQLHKQTAQDHTDNTLIITPNSEGNRKQIQALPDIQLAKTWKSNQTYLQPGAYYHYNMSRMSLPNVNNLQSFSISRNHPAVYRRLDDPSIFLRIFETVATGC